MSKKRGRPTREQELTEFAATAGIDMETVADYLGGALTPPPEEELPSLEQIRQEFLVLLYRQRNDLRGIAFVQALKAIDSIRSQEPPPPEDEDTRRPVLDRVDALPPEHAAGLLRQELARTDKYRDELFAALTNLEAK